MRIFAPDFLTYRPMKPQLLIGAPTSGSGKTMFTLGLLRALKKRGLKVQPYKGEKMGFGKRV